MRMKTGSNGMPLCPSCKGETRSVCERDFLPYGVLSVCTCSNCGTLVAGYQGIDPPGVDLDVEVELLFHKCAAKLQLSVKRFYPV